MSLRTPASVAWIFRYHFPFLHLSPVLQYHARRDTLFPWNTLRQRTVEVHLVSTARLRLVAFAAWKIVWHRINTSANFYSGKFTVLALPNGQALCNSSRSFEGIKHYVYHQDYKFCHSVIFEAILKKYSLFFCVSFLYANNIRMALLSA